jgi:hypothetical protein
MFLVEYVANAVEVIPRSIRRDSTKQVMRVILLRFILFSFSHDNFRHLGIHPAGRPAYPAVLTAYHTPGKEAISSCVIFLLRQMTTPEKYPRPASGVPWPGN